MSALCKAKKDAAAALACAEQAKADVAASALVCSTFCPTAIANTDGIDSPLNLNPLNPTAITYNGWQSQDNAVIEATGTGIEITGSDVCSTVVHASVTAVNVTGGATGNAQRAHPELWLLKNGNRVALAQVYIRDFAGQDSDTWQISWPDIAPQQGDVYSLEVDRDSIETEASGQATATLEIFSDVEPANYLSVIAHRRFDLCKTAP